jgi:hypothetical protein
MRVIIGQSARRFLSSDSSKPLVLAGLMIPDQVFGQAERELEDSEHPKCYSRSPHKLRVPPHQYANMIQQSICGVLELLFSA